MRRWPTYVLLLTIGSGCAMTVYDRGPPKRMQVERDAGEGAGVVVAAAERLADGAIEVQVLRERQVGVRRQVVYGTVRTVVGGDWRVEIVDFLFALVGTPFMAAMILGYGIDGGFTEGRVIENFQSGVIFAGLSPVGSWFAPSMEQEITDDEVFTSLPAQTRYQTRLPVVGAPVTYTLLDRGRQELAKGAATSDAHGVLLIAAPPPGARTVRVEALGEVAEATLPPRR